MPDPGAPGSTQGGTKIAQAAVDWRQPGEAILRQAFLREPVGGVLDGHPADAAREVFITPGFSVVTDTSNTLRVVAVVMVLVDGAHAVRSVHHGDAKGVGLANEPGI